MQNIYNRNGIPFWTEKDIITREFLINSFIFSLKNALVKTNPAWSFHRIEAPILTPNELINSNYTEEDVWVQSGSELTLRPETTSGSYEYMAHLIEHYLDKPPFVVWQVGKSFRREQDQPSKNCRFKEFYQMELQCVYTSDTLNDYQSAILEDVKDIFSSLFKNEIRIVPSDRLPSYSLKTIDIEINTGEDNWMELASISVRNDFKQKFKNKDLLVLEIAIGIDRCVYNF